MSQFPYQSQPAWIDGSTVETQIRVRAFIRSVYGWMFGGLLLGLIAALSGASMTGPVSAD